MFVKLTGLADRLHRCERKRTRTSESEDFALSNRVHGGAIRKIREYHYPALGRGTKNSVGICELLMRDIDYIERQRRIDS